jgi:hypothetical protein
MDKNKIISIVLLIIVLFLTLAIGLFFSFTPKRVYVKNEMIESLVNYSNSANEPDPTILFNQLQGLYLFIRIINNFYNNSKYKDITYEILSNFTTSLLIGDIQQFIINPNNKTPNSNITNPNNKINDIQIDMIIGNKYTCDFYYTNKNDTNICNYKINNGNDFKYYIKRLYNTLIKHDIIKLNNNYIKSDYINNIIIEKIEILFVQSFVPVALYNMYITEYNQLIEQYSDAFQSYDDYVVFVQMFISANQMNFISTNTNVNIDTSGNKINFTDLKRNTGNTGGQNVVDEYMNKIMYIYNIDSSGKEILVDLLEPSYILFYKCLLYFVKKYNK